ncbi:MAG: hypothetical protein RR851_13075 [Clostridium sp.]
MNILLCTGLALIGVLVLMGHITLKSKLNSLGEQIKVNSTHIDGQAEKIISNIEGKAQFEEKAIGVLAQNIAMCAYESKDIKDQVEIINNNVLQLRQSNFDIDVNTEEIKTLIEESTNDINKTVKGESAKILFTPLKIKCDGGCGK